MLSMASGEGDPTLKGGPETVVVQPPTNADLWLCLIRRLTAAPGWRFTPSTAYAITEEHVRNPHVTISQLLRRGVSFGLSREQSLRREQVAFAAKGGILAANGFQYQDVEHPQSHAPLDIGTLVDKNLLELSGNGRKQELIVTPEGHAHATRVEAPFRNHPPIVDPPNYSC